MFKILFPFYFFLIIYKGKTRKKQQGEQDEMLITPASLDT